MATYVTVADVDETLGPTWASESDKARYVAMANAYLSSLHVRVTDPVADEVILAGSELAGAAADGELYAQVTEGALTRKKVKAGSAEVEKSFAKYSSEGYGHLPSRVQFALALIEGFREVGMGITVGYGCVHDLSR